MNKKNIIFGIFSIICMIVIFLFSSDNGEQSSVKSNFFVELITELLNIQTDEKIETIIFLVRKTAHFTIYAVLGFLISGTFQIKKFSIYPLLICFLYACSDEIHQYFVPERACRFQDIMIDTAGSLSGIFIFLIFAKIYKSIKKAN